MRQVSDGLSEPFGMTLTQSRESVTGVAGDRASQGTVSGSVEGDNRLGMAGTLVAIPSGGVLLRLESWSTYLDSPGKAMFGTFSIRYCVTPPLDGGLPTPEPGVGCEALAPGDLAPFAGTAVRIRPLGCQPPSGTGGVQVVNRYLVGTKYGPVDLYWFKAHEDNHPNTTPAVPSRNPSCEKPNSGLTVCAGYDVGQHSLAEVSGMLGNSPQAQAIYQALAPAVGLVGDCARPYVEQIALTTSDCTLIDEAWVEQSANHLADVYLRDSQRVFKDLPGAAQTAFLDMAYRWPYMETVPALWGPIINADWLAVVNWLLNQQAWGIRAVEDAALLWSVCGGAANQLTCR